MSALKNSVKSVFRRFGLQITRVNGAGQGLSPDDACVGSVKESEYYTRWTTPYPLFAPWTGHPDFQAYYDDVPKNTLVSPDRCYMLFALAKHALKVEGDFAECGVFRGGTSLLLSRVLRDSPKTLHMFDSFAGLPDVDRAHDNFYQKGDLAFRKVEEVEKLLSSSRNHRIHVGWIPDTFASLDVPSFAFVHVDVDLYKPTLDCLDYFYGRVSKSGILIFDDYGFPSCRGEKDAVDEFFNDKPEKPVVLPTGQALVIKA